ncbi:Lrp/AsnC family transcriptional regulator [uncultured Aquincola sp.]|uniref:Lrp/AsnC family transcriptional regulator n=1 Tax=uncultured Aquincola sp. TaxID=886556 RepID=UPI0032B11C23|tara:strand:- start:2095 stop:2568 length:474 start_codon:yes stop_codon:yes gene_type:complete
MTTTPDPLDSFDRQILDIVQRDNQRKAEAIAQQVGLSASAVQRRLKRLRAQGVIRAEVAVLDRQAVGPSVTLIAGIEIDRDNYPALAAFRAWAAREDAIQQVYYVTGTTDLVAVVMARDMAAYDALCERLMTDIPQIRRINTQVVIDAIKVGLQVPV